MKLLFILHRSPPAHGAAKVGDFIASSQLINRNFECKYITIKSSDTIGDIGKINLKKVYLVVDLYLKIFWALLIFRPQKIYFTASISSVAFYRDLLISTLWKTYKLFKSVDIYYHYHTKGVNRFVSTSERNLRLTRFFLKNVNLILLSPMLVNDFEKVLTYEKVLYLPNGVKHILEDADFKEFTETKYRQQEPLEVLYLSNMIKSKGYFDLLELANSTLGQNVHYHFAGSWQNDHDKNEFFHFIDKNNLEDSVTFHGFVNGNEKRKLFEKVHLFIFPTRYPNEAFPLSILEALSYGLPVIATDEGSIPYILDEQSGIVIDDVQKLPEALEMSKVKLVNIKTAQYCRGRFLKNFTLANFEEKLVEIFKD